MHTLDQSHVHKKSQIVNLVLESVDSNEVLPLSRVHVVDKTPIKLMPLQFNYYSHLQGIPGGVSDAGVDILIGQDNAEALFPLEMRRDKKGEPIAIRTLLGCLPIAIPQLDCLVFSGISFSPETSILLQIIQIIHMTLWKGGQSVSSGPRRQTQ